MKNGFTKLLKGMAPGSGIIWYKEVPWLSFAEHKLVLTTSFSLLLDIQQKKEP